MLRDRLVANLTAGLPGLFTLAVFVVAVTNGIGEIQARIESHHFHSAPHCAAGARASDNCVQVVPVSIEGYMAGPSIVLKIPGQGVVPVPVGDVRPLDPSRPPASTPEVYLWHGKVMEVYYDDQQLISANSPDLYVVTWQILLPYGFLLLFITVLVYLVMSWATGYGFLPDLPFLRG